MFGAESLYPPYFCDKSQKPGKMARARPRIDAWRGGRPIPSCKRSGRRQDRRANAPGPDASRLPMVQYAVADRPVARRALGPSTRTGRGRQ
ncbi:hypothetical protein WT22_23575 [Burkholderia territorii]|nr:hypothetical protein WT22_23575 [Burkholderia territorii]KWA34939.1 hypothetical protein WT40_11870 [Burkholderia territorii]